MIMDYIEGGERCSYEMIESFSPMQRNRFYTSVADICMDLRRLEFNLIGQLIIQDGAFFVGKPPLTMDINCQALEGLNPQKIMEQYGAGGPLTTADEYTNLLLDIGDNAFRESRGSVPEDHLGPEFLYNLHSFRQFVNNWKDKAENTGPFVLTHGDFQPFNLLVSEEGEVVTVLDWEWARVVPRQYFTPPLWLKGANATEYYKAASYDTYVNDDISDFFNILRSREQAKYGTTALASEWIAAKNNGGFLVPGALECWTHMDYFAYFYINKKLYRDQGFKDRVQAFMAADPARAEFVKKKIEEGRKYKIEAGHVHGTPPEEQGVKEVGIGAVLRGVWNAFMGGG